MAQGDINIKSGKSTTSKIYKDSSELKLTAYNIEGNNYFNLRDLAEEFNIGVTWDEFSKTVGVDTSIGYIAD